MKVVIIAPGSLPIPAKEGGAVETLIDVILSYLKKSEHEAYVFSGSINIKHDISFSDGNIHYFQKKQIVLSSMGLKRVLNRINPNYMYESYLRYIVRELSCIEYDCILVENRPLFIDYLYKHTSKPIYLHMHNDPIPGYRGLLPRIDIHCKKIITVSKYIENCILRDYPSANTCVVHNGVSEIEFQKERDPERSSIIRDRYNLRQDEIVICFTGRLLPQKGVLELIKAYSNLKTNLNIVLLIIGATWFGSNTTDKYTEEVKLAASVCKNRISFTGYIDHHEVSEVESIANIAVMPSIWEEPFALSILEAMSSGLAVITTTSGGTPEMFDEGSGILIDRDDKLVDNLTNALSILINNEGMRNDMGRNARARIENIFNQDNFYNHIIRVLTGDC